MVMGYEASAPYAPAADQARAWRSALPRDCWKRSDLHGGLIFAVNTTLYIALFLGMFWLPIWWLRIAAMATLPWVIGALFVSGHDACHGSLVRTGWLNRVLGRLCLLPAYHPYTSWTHAHNTLHHGGTNLKGKEPAFPPFSKEEFDRLPLWRRLLERVYRTPPGIGLFYAVDFYFLRLVVPSARQRSPYRLAFQLDRVLVAGFFVAQFVLARHLAAGREGGLVGPEIYAVLTVTIPWMLWIWFMGFVSFVQHTHPRIAWYDQEEEWSFYHVQLKSTAHVAFPWLMERVLHNIMSHTAHHIDPGIPLYELPRSQQLLEETCPEHAVVIQWSVWDYFHTCVACKLYDFRRHCWTDFNGVPTSPTGLSGLPEPGTKKVSGPFFAPEEVAS
jgi:omega-6 fatty acid desaturase (delta-12 desaturase)